MLTSPSTPSTRAVMTCGMLREKKETIMPQIARIMAHSSSDPSCAPQTADTL